MNLGENPTLTEEVKSDNELKTWLINYVGEKKNPQDDRVTVEMVIETLSEDFPEFLMAFAEENWVRGYHQALVDIDEGEKLLKESEEGSITDQEWVEEHNVWKEKKCKKEDCEECECEEKNG
tara:strand:- start:123 stop:488 length:366 start_codon:yes stop_codon:yes gene_type:complete